MFKVVNVSSRAVLAIALFLVLVSTMLVTTVNLIVSLVVSNMLLNLNQPVPLAVGLEVLLILACVLLGLVLLFASWDVRRD